MSRTKACLAAQARIVFVPVCGIHSEERLDVVTDIVRETIKSEAEQCANFYRLSPCFTRSDGAMELIVYRDGYVKKHPQRFGLKRQDLKDISSTQPEEFEDCMRKLHKSISEIIRPKTEATYELISIFRNGSEYIHSSSAFVSHAVPFNDPETDGYNLDDFGEIEGYSIDPELFEEEFGSFFPEGDFGEECGDEYDESSEGDENDDL